MSEQNHYRRFIEQVLDSGEIWGLQSGPSWAYCESSEYEETDVLLFWSERAAAERHIQGEWGQHEAVVIALDDFIDHWLNGMHDDGALVGPNWDVDLNGPEIEPDEVSAELSGDAAGEP